MAPTGLRRRTVGPGVAALVLAAVGLGAVQPSGADPLPRPVIASLSSSPASLPRDGGTLSLTAVVGGAVTCTVSSTRPVAGLPATRPCSTGSATWSTALPANTGRTALVYRFTVTATGAGGLTARRTTVVVARTASTPLDGVSAVSAGGNDTCAVQADGASWCWGDDRVGQFGNGTSGPHLGALVAQPLPALDGLRSVSPGEATCAIQPAGSVACWGANRTGALGDGSFGGPGCHGFCSPTPVPVVGLTGVRQVSAGGATVCALASDGTVWCWGADNGFRAAGTDADVAEPVPVPGITGAEAIAVSATNGCAMLAGGTVDCWGDNSAGQLGDGSTTPSPGLVTVPGLRGVRSIGVGIQTVCALLADRSVSCWGRNDYGQLGDASTADSSTPVPVPGLSGVQTLGVGEYHSCALTGSGTVSCWGQGTSGELGDGAAVNSSTPVPVSGLVGVQAITVGSSHTCALMADATLRCWGYGRYGQLGDGVVTNALVPVPVSGP